MTPSQEQKDRNPSTAQCLLNEYRSYYVHVHVVALQNENRDSLLIVVFSA